MTTVATSTRTDATSPGASPLVVFSPTDGSALVIFHNGTAPRLAKAQSPYSTWSAQSVGANTTRSMDALRINSDDSVDVMVCSPSNDAWYFQYVRSGNNWAYNGDKNIVSGAGPTTINAQAAQWHKDSHNRIWWVAGDATLATRKLFVDYCTDPLATWTHSLNVTVNGVYYGLPFSAIIGNYLVVVYQNGSGDLVYQRLDVSGASLGSWSTAASLGLSDIATSTQGDFESYAANKGMLVYNGSGGIKALTYDASTDTWGAATTLTSSTSDRHPTLCPDGAGNVYAVWSKFDTGSNYAIVSLGYNGSAWDGATTALVASAAGLSWPNAKYRSGNIGLLYTAGTASPYNVNFEMISAPAVGGGGGGTPQDIYGGVQAASAATGRLTVSKPVSGRVTLSAPASSRLTVAKPIAGGGSAAVQASLAIQVTKQLSGVFQMSAGASVALTVAKLLAGRADLQTSGALDLTVLGGADISGRAALQALASLLLLSVEKKLRGTASAQMAGRLTLDTARTQDIFGRIALQTSASLVLTRTVRVGGQAGARAGGQVVLTVHRQLRGAAGVTAGGRLVLTVVDMHYREPNGTVELLASFAATVALADAPTADVELLPAPEGTVE